MNKRFVTVAALISMWAASLALSVAQAASLQELQQRFQQRYPQLLQVKTAGKVGETFQGYVEATRPEFTNDPAVAGIVNAENADRVELYRIMAAQVGATPESVAQRNAVRNFSTARPGEWLKYPNGWVQKR